MKSIVEQIFRRGAETPDKAAILDGKLCQSYSDLIKAILFARCLLRNKYHLCAGDKVILAADKQIEFVAVYFACHLLGVATVPIAPDTNETRYKLIKSKTQPHLVVGFIDSGKDTQNARYVDFLGKTETSDFSDLFFPAMDTLADIVFTTGTTGEPKGVMLSQKNIAAAANNINSFIKNKTSDVEILALPISHSFGLGRMRCAISNGQTLVLLGSFANVKQFFYFIREYHATGFGMVPASWALLKKLSGLEIAKFKDQLHYIEIGSAPMPLEEKYTLIELLPDTRICMHYGLTEASRSTFIEFHSEIDHLMTIGKQSPNMHISIRDDNGNEVPDETTGEICVEGDAVTTGYLDLPKSNSFWNNFFRTGDCGYKDKTGYVYLKSRKKELINVGGKKVSPMEVEAILQTFDFVDDCACVAFPDPNGILGEVVKAFIVTKQVDKVNFEFIDGLIGNQLEGFKHPALYEVIDKIPKTSSGKVQRLLLK